jgi:hypothetical protein
MATRKNAKWKPGQLEKFRASMAKRRKAANNGVQSIPLEAIPDRTPVRASSPQLQSRTDRLRLAAAVTQLLLSILNDRT